MIICFTKNIDNFRTERCGFRGMEEEVLVYQIVQCARKVNISGYFLVSSSNGLCYKTQRNHEHEEVGKWPN